MRFPSPRHKPPWWPENEDFPPRHWRHDKRNPFSRRVGCLFRLFSLAGAVLFIAAITSALNYFGVTRVPLELFSWALIPIGIIFAFFVGISLIVGAVRMRRMSAPLDEALAAFQKIEAGDYSARMEEKGWRESRSLAQGFNAMADKLQVNDQQRRNMLADISHELRNPITVIQGNLEAMLDGVYAADPEKLKSLHEETQILLRLAEDLKTFSLAEAGALTLKRELTDLGQLIRETVALFETAANEKEIALETSVAENIEREIDPLRVREALTNLLGNAIRHTPQGGKIKIGLTQANENAATVFIHDSGAGIEAADLNQIFDRFYKSSDSGGMGLGLSIARVLVEAHGGKIWAENENGAKISFTL